MDSTELIRRTTAFAHQAVRVAANVPNSTLGRHIRQQLTRCSTSVAANYRAAILAQSRASFKAKISIVLEEIDESVFWLEFAMEEELMSTESLSSVLTESKELRNIFFATRKTLQS